jgi:hypothetical protein
MVERTRGEVFAALVEAVLAEEHELKISLVQRATNVITSAGVLVTVSLVLSTLISRMPPAEVPKAAIACFGAAVLLLLSSALLTLLVNSPRRQDTLDVDALKRHPFQPSDWTTVDKSDFEVFRLRLDLATVLSTANQRRARYLAAALTLELIVLTALSAAAIITTMPIL